MRYLSLQGMPLQNYLAAWYLGSFIGALIVFVLGGRKERGEPLTGKQMVQVASLAVVLWVSLGLEYWSKMLAPLTVVQPIYQVSEMVLPTFIGLWIFKERLGLNYKAWVAIGAGLLGGMIIALSY
jgi:drug/metabolite transporter (DMT)-like permease